MQVAIWRGVHVVQRRTPDAVRCTLQVEHRRCGCRSWRHVDQLKVRGHRHALECRLRHRLTLLPWSIPGNSPSASSGVMCLAKSSSRAWRGAASVTASREIVVAVGTQPTPTDRPRLVFVAEVRDCASCPFGRCRRHALFMTTSSNEPSITERARVALACAWMQLLKMRKTATSQGCTYDVLRGGMMR